MGHMYTLDTDDLLEKIHTVLVNVYGGEYPIYEILSQVSIDYWFTDLFLKLRFLGDSNLR